MKKSKILAVALSALTFSTAAAVTGTVAWYFAQRTVSVEMNSIQSINPESGLKVTLTGKIGVTVQSATSKSASSPAKVQQGLIRDGSLDLVGKNAYRALLNHAGTGVTGFEALDYDAEADMKGELYEEGETDPVEFFYATSYDAKFELTRKVSGSKFAVYYDNSELDVSGSSLVQESLRIGFVYDGGTEDASDDSFFVVAPFRKTGGTSYVQGTGKDDNDGNYTNVSGLTPVNRLMYGFETKYEKAITSYMDKDGNTVNVPAFNNSYSAEAMFVDTYEPDPDHDGQYRIKEKGVQLYNATKTGSAATTDNLQDLGASVAEADAPKTLGFLGILDSAAENDGDDGLAINVRVYTWFEGTDKSSISEWVDDEQLSTTFKFVMVEVE